MVSIRLATAGNVRGFHTLSSALNDSDGKWAHLVDYEGFQDEIGRFRVWSGNLGALQKGHSSLDYRLRDSPLLSSNALKFLQDLEDNINEAIAIVTEARLPYESQPKPGKSEADDDDDDDSFFDEDEDEDDDDGAPRSELSMRFAEIVDIIDNLYKLSVRIRTPTIRSRSLKAATYKPKDPDTGVDILSTYSVYDVQHVKELLFHLRQIHIQDTQSNDHDYLIDRLSAAITLRRRQFKYWKRHRDKLGISSFQEEQISADRPLVDRPSLPQRNDTLEVLPDIPIIAINKEAHSQKTGKTLLSGTEATQHHQSLDEIVDTKSVTSYAVTVKDLHGRGVELPPPPRAADGEKDFECPFCYIICPARYGRGRAWRTHLLQDLQPYICTYPDCVGFEQLFRSRREWAEHEASHRKVWRCPEHTAAVYKSNAGLEEHFRREHADSIPESQLSAIVKVGETTTVDVRTQCPICFAPADTEGLGDFHNHIANHLERIATFALPNGNEDESDGASSAASRGRSDNSQSRNMSDLSLPTDASDVIATEAERKTNLKEVTSKHEMHHFEGDPQQTTGEATLSAESLGRLPDATEIRLKTLFAGRTIKHDNSLEALDSDTDSSVYLESDPEDEAQDKGADKYLLQVSDIPTLRSLYRSRRLLQRDQSFNPNDSYNQVISLCHHDLTRIKVDAIVNGANRAMKVTGGETLNNAIHRAAGPGLARETKTRGRLKNEAVFTSGHKLPSKHIIHVLRPGYSNSSGMGQFNQLVDCYRNAFNMAITLELETIAFPCLGTGGVGFPARVAARIVLQEVREYLDKHPEYRFERIVFCVNSAADEMAYIDFLPVFFPPTHDDLEAARSSVWTGDRATAALDALKARNEIQKVVWDLNLGFGISVSNFNDTITNHFRAIDQALISIRQFLLSSKELICGSVAETIDLANDHSNLGQRNDVAIWSDFVTTMEDMHGRDPSWLLGTCRYFAQGLENMITKGGVGADEVVDLIDIRQKLERYKVKQRGGRDVDGTQDHLNEVLYTREFQRQTIAQSRENIKIHKIPTVTQLYKLGELEEKVTLARPSIEFNDKICLAREDITKIEVDVMVNSSDEAFEGVGALSRTVFLKGGVQLREAVKTFGKCQAGDVRLTAGYLLPAKHILHVIPPKLLRQNTKNIMRKIYREVLYTAVTLGAASIALPSIALEEAKRFLESSIPGSLIEKIIFVVYSSNDEFVYKSLLPVYFPPPDMNVNRALPASIVRQDIASTTSSSSSDKPPRNLYGSIGEAFRSLRPGKPFGASRPISGNEEHTLINFESHAQDCHTCKDIDKLYLEGRDLCKDGDELAKIILWHMNMESDMKVYAHPPVQGKSTGLDVPTDMFPISLKLLATVEKSQRDGDGSRLFVARNRPYGATSHDQGQDIVPPGVTIHSGEFQISKEPEPKKARAYVSIMNLSGQWDLAAPTECQILVHPNSVDVVEHIAESGDQVPLMSHVFTSQSKVQRRKTTPEVELYGCPRLESRNYTAEAVLFRCRSDNECNALLRSIRKALDEFQAPTSSDEQQRISAPPAVAAQDTSREYSEWNQRLRDIQSELATVRRSSGGLSDLQYKMERLGMATASLSPSAKQDSNASHLYDATRSPLATRILVLLTADLKSRPGSYIGLETNRIVAELPATYDEVSSALQELIEQDQVHNTVDGDTWVISHPPKDLPVLSEEQYSPIQASREASPSGTKGALEPSNVPSEDASLRMESNKPDQAAESASSSPAFLPKKPRPDIDLTLDNNKHHTGPSSLMVESDEPLRLAADRFPDSAYQISPSETIWTRIDKSMAHSKVLIFDGEQFDDMGDYWLVHREVSRQDVDLWLTKGRAMLPSETLEWSKEEVEGQLPRLRSQAEEAVRGDESKEKPSSLSNDEILRLGTDRLPDSDYFISLSGQAWTRIKKRHVYSEILAAANESFDDAGAHFLVYRAVGKDELMQWVLDTHRLEGDEKEKWEEEKRKAFGPHEDMGLTQNKGKKKAEPWSPVSEHDEIIRLGADRLPDSDYYESPSGSLWTRVKKIYVYSGILVAANEEFSDSGSEFLVHRAAGKSDMQIWTEKTQAMPQAEKKKWEDEQIDAREALQMGSGTPFDLLRKAWTVDSRPEHAADEGPEPQQDAPIVRDVSEFSDTPPSPTEPSPAPQEDRELRLDARNLDNGSNYASPSGARWTRVGKSLVDPRVLVAADEAFEDLGDGLVVHRVLRRGEVDRWAEESVRVREADKGKGKGKQKERARDDRDEYQERLDRVIAGDMREEELRRFGDGDEERYI
ncbi:hypothetical protein DE146DRAFT_635725 [Phaeosphaeria sp. MPI-PUGE-AT-0046c]|nr:hypothetical protein DE146DRAFT_635725 [Phaeosphaeria sp. MPI-PUGE-AT-0046c]